MTIIAVPANFSFTAVKSFGLKRSSNTLRSKFTAVRQALVYPFAVWQFEGTLVSYDGDAANKIRSFLVLLEGPKNKFKLPVPGYTKPSSGYTATTTLTLAAAGAVRATSLQFGGAIGGVAFLNEGDYFTIQDELKMVTQTVIADGSGYATIPFQPPLRKAAAGGISAIIVNPYCLMNATADDVANWSIAPPVRQGVSISAIEAIELP